MTTGEKIAKLRKEINYTQEQLADHLGVSRQSVSKWESDLAFPETDKLLEMGRLFDCSIDYLLKEEVEEKNITKQVHVSNGNMFYPFYEYKSKKTLFGLPLVHVCANPKKTAKGIIAIGVRSVGFISCGVLSLGLLSFGTISVGLISFGVLSLGLLLAIGSIAAGLFAIGAVAFGLFFALGAVARGLFAVGAIADGYYFALGDIARGKVSIGNSEAVGEVFEYAKKTAGGASLDKSLVISKLYEIVPKGLAWLIELAKGFIGA